MRIPLPHSLHAKLSLAFAVALLPLLALILWGVRSDLRQREESILENQLLTADAVAVQIEETFDAALAMAWTVANDPIAQALDPQQLDGHLANLLGRHPAFDSIGVFNAQGQNRGWASLSAPAEPRLNIADRSYFQVVMGTNGPSISEVLQLERPENASGIVAAVPLRNEQEQTIGVVAISMRTRSLSKWFEEARLRPGQAVLLVDRAGRLAFHTAERSLPYDHSGAFMDFPPLRRALSGSPQAIPVFQSPILNDERIGAFVPTRKYRWVIGITIPRAIVLEPVQAGLRRNLFGFLAVLLLSGILATLVTRHLTAPLSRLRKHAQALGRGDLSGRVDVTTGDELEELGAAFNEMAQQLQDRDAHLRASEERFRATFEQAAVGIAHMDIHGRWLRVNDRLCEVLCYSREELLQLTNQKITHPDDRDRDIASLRKLHEGEIQTYVTEKRYCRKDGSFVWVNLTVTLTKKSDGDPPSFIVVVEDITQRKRMEEDRRQLLLREQSARASAEAANRTKDQFLAVVSHELRTPLTPVLAALDLLDTEADVSEDGKSSLMMIRGNIEMEARLISDLLDLTRLQQGKFAVQRTTVHAHAIVSRMYRYFEHEIKAKRIEFKLDLRARDDTIFADPDRIQQVFWNLVGNAVKFTPLGGHIVIQSRNEPGVLKVMVTDTGIGITEDVMQRLFNAFEQGEQTLTRRYGGLGLGLTISKALVELHDGQLTAASDGRGRGATFTVTLPLQKPQQRETAAPVQPPPLEAPTPGKRRILLVEDNPQTAKILARLLEKAGYAVKIASCAHEALESARSEHPDLLISDLGLPDVSGWELLRELRKTEECPAVAISGFGTPEDQQKSREVGFAHHLIKPVDFQALKEVIHQVTP